MSELTAGEIKELKEELRVGSILIAKLTDQCRELEDQLAKSPSRSKCPTCEGTRYLGGPGINDLCDDCQGTGIDDKRGLVKEILLQTALHFRNGDEEYMYGAIKQICALFNEGEIRKKENT